MKQQSYRDEKAVREEQLDRLDYNHYSQKPYCSLVSLISSNKIQTAYGTGFMISPNLILTAAHNVYDKGSSNKQVSKYQRILYVQTDKEQVSIQDYQLITQYKYDLPSDFKLLQQNVKHDFALLRIPSSEDHYQKCLELTICCQHCTFNLKHQKQLKIYGYPISSQIQAFQNYNPPKAEKFKLKQWGKKGEGRLHKVQFDNYRICYEMTTFPGQSGTAIMYGDYLVGIHKAGDNNFQFNFGRIITVQMVQKLIDWMVELNAKPFRINDRQVCQHLREKVDILQNRLASINKMRNMYQQIIDDLIRQKEKKTIDNQKPKIEIEKLKFGGSKMADMNINSANNIQKLNRVKQNLQEIDVTEYHQVTILLLSGNILKHINLSMNTELIILQLWNNKLTHVNLMSNTKLTQLRLQNNLLTSIDLTNNPRIHRLQLNYNKLNQISLCFNPQMPWNLKNGKMGLLIYNQKSTHCKVTFFFNQQHEALCDKFIEQGEIGFGIKSRGLFQIIFPKYIEDNRYWQNQDKTCIQFRKEKYKND